MTTSDPRLPQAPRPPEAARPSKSPGAQRAGKAGQPRQLQPGRASSHGVAASQGLQPVAGLELHPGQSVELLKELHILTREGKLNQDSRRKLKQVNHLLQFIEPLLQQVLDERGDVTLADHGAGKSYLGFMLYDRFFSQRSVGQVFGIETRTELVAKSQQLA
ncbi:MAG: methyltransferase, partial [Burkholderiaceae bacterium]|nr:methyltransferase [Burkholderiaceae bacterium]